MEFKKTIKIEELKINPNNPRLIKDFKFKKLVQSIKDFPQMLEIRPIVVNNEMIILGGNMRFKACIEAGLKEVPVIITDLTDAQQREFLIKDNTSGGEWDWDALANEWNNQQLGDWGLDIWLPESEVDYTVLDEIDLEETLENKEAGVKRAIMIEFNPEHYDEANKLITEARKNGKNVGLIVLNAFNEYYDI